MIRNMVLQQYRNHVGRNWHNTGSWGDTMVPHLILNGHDNATATAAILLYSIVTSEREILIGTAPNKWTKNKTPHDEKTHSYSILRVPTTQLTKMSIDLKFVKLTADVLEN